MLPCFVVVFSVVGGGDDVHVCNWKFHFCMFIHIHILILHRSVIFSLNQQSLYGNRTIPS
jgi:hypothetical protein